MTTEELKALGLDDDTISKIFVLHGKAINAEKAKVTTLESEKNGLQTKYDKLDETLKSFDGVDVNALNTKIKELEGELQGIEEKKRLEAEEQEFNSVTTEAIKKLGGKNSKAIMALLDVEALKKSKNQSTDIEKALTDIRKENEYLFGANEPINKPTSSTNTTDIPNSDDAEVKELMKAMGLTEDDLK